MFIPKILKLTDWKSRLIQDKVGFLNDLIRASVINIPFQNITCIGSVDISQRRAPTLEDALISGLTGRGGLCGHNNTFMNYTLKSLGYETYLASGNFRRTGISGSHILCTVRIPYSKANNSETDTKGLSTNKMAGWYIVDVGCSVILHEAIPISKLPYKSRAGGLNFRYEMTSNGIMQRVNECGDSIVGQKHEGYLSPQDYTIDLTPVKHFNNFIEPIRQYFSDPTKMLSNSLFCFRYLDISEDDFKAVWIRGTEVILATKELRSSITYSDYYELRPVIEKYFPMIPSEQVKLAVENFTKSLEVMQQQKFAHQG